MKHNEVVTEVYDQEYFSGSQMFLYIGDVWLDEVVSLSYSRQQSKSPIFGYASQLFDDVAAGQVIVQGNFTINYKEQGYLWAVLRRYHNQTASDVNVSTSHDSRLLGVRKGRRRTQPEITNDRGNIVASNGTSINRQTIERVTQGELTRGDRFKFYQHLAGYSTFKTDSPRDKAFEDIAEAFEDQIWEPNQQNFDLNNQIRRIDDNAFDNFDIYVVFGNYSNPRANHTVQKIIGVHLLSETKTIKIDGEPVKESYSFIARTTA